MGDATTLLFGLDGFRVVSVSEDDEHADDGRRVVVEGVEDEQACPDCGVLSGKVHARKLRRVKDLPHGRRPLRLWHQRRWACRERGAAGAPLPRPASRSGRGGA